MAGALGEENIAHLQPPLLSELWLYLSGDRVDNPLHINREKTGISQAFMELNIRDMLITANLLGKHSLIAILPRY